jgi:hypothetical protein
MTDLEKARYLRERGWKQATHKGPWAWKHPVYPAYYLLRDAYDLATSEEKEKKRENKK